MKKPNIWRPADWEAEAVDFLCMELEKLSNKELLEYARDARAFIMKTMGKMEVRPRRSYLRRIGK